MTGRAQCRKKGEERWLAHPPSCEQCSLEDEEWGLEFSERVLIL